MLEFLMSHSDDILLNKLSFAVITKLCCTSRRMYYHLSDGYNQLVPNINVYLWSRSHTMYVTMWGDGLSRFIHSDYIPQHAHNVKLTNFWAHFSLSELNYHDDELFENLGEYYNTAGLQTNYYLDTGKITGEAQTSPPPVIVCDRY